MSKTQERQKSPLSFCPSGSFTLYHFLSLPLSFPLSSFSTGWGLKDVPDLLPNISHHPALQTWLNEHTHEAYSHVPSNTEHRQTGTCSSQRKYTQTCKYTHTYTHHYSNATSQLQICRPHIHTVCLAHKRKRERGISRSLLNPIFKQQHTHTHSPML